MVPLHFGNRGHPQNCRPWCLPLRAVRRTISVPHLEQPGGWVSPGWHGRFASVAEGSGMRGFRAGIATHPRPRLRLVPLVRCARRCSGTHLRPAARRARWCHRDNMVRVSSGGAVEPVVPAGGAGEGRSGGHSARRKRCQLATPLRRRQPVVSSPSSDKQRPALSQGCAQRASLLPEVLG